MSALPLGSPVDTSWTFLMGPDIDFQRWAAIEGSVLQRPDWGPNGEEDSMRRVLFTVFLGIAGLASNSGQARAECEVGDCWGAVAFGPGGAWAYAINEPSREDAARAAQRQCGGDCTNVLTFHNSCGAYASGSGGYGWGNASNREDAEERAMEECEKVASGCRIRVWGCTTR